MAPGNYLLTVKTVGGTPFPFTLPTQVSTGTSVDPNVPYRRVGWGPYNIVADLDGDGIPELFTGDGSIFRSQGDGTFKFKSSYPFNHVNYAGTFRYPLVWSVNAADLNGDGRLDLIGVVEFDHDLHGYLAVRLANPDGTYDPEVDYPTLGEDTVSVAVGDVNNDGKADLVACNYGGLTRSKDVSLLLGNGDGTFQGASVFSSSVYGNDFLPLDVALADVDTTMVSSISWSQTTISVILVSPSCLARETAHFRRDSGCYPQSTRTAHSP